MVFPGVLRGRPGPRLATIHTNRPRRSLSSPWMYCAIQCSGHLNKSTRSRAALRNLSPVSPKASRRLVARPYTSVASLLRLGVRVYIQSTPLESTRQEGIEQFSPHIPKKRSAAREAPGKAVLGKPRKVLRLGLSQLRQWVYGRRSACREPAPASPTDRLAGDRRAERSGRERLACGRSPLR